MTKYRNALQQLKQLTKQFEKNAKHSKCFSLNCNNKSIRSHSISESRVLRFIAENSSDKHILYLDDSIDFDFKNVSISTFHELRRKLKKNGKGDTSVFYGFCHSCDPDFFRRIDNEVYQNQAEINFLHAYRGFAYYIQTQNHILSFVSKKITPIQKEISLPSNFEKTTEQFSLIPDDFTVEYELVKPALEKISLMHFYDNKTLKEEMSVILESFLTPKNYPMKGIDFKNSTEILISKFLKTALSYEELGALEEKVNPFIKVNESLSKLFFDTYQSKEYDKMLFLYIHQNFPYQITGNFVFQGAQNDLMSLTFFPEIETQKSHFIFCSIAPNQNQKNYFSQIKIKKNIDFQLFVSELILKQGSNIYFSASYWEALPPKIQNLMKLKKSQRNQKLLNENIFIKN